MNGIDQKKLLIFLVAIVLFVNYLNYFQPDRARLYREIHLLENKIAKERKLDMLHVDPETLKIPQSKLFFDGTKLSYSQAMGALQKLLRGDAKAAQCKVLTLKWAPVPARAGGYERLKIAFSLRCRPENFFGFVRRARQEGKLLLFENLLLGKARERGSSGSELVATGQAVAFRRTR